MSIALKDRLYNPMKITFVVPFITLTGGIKGVYEYANKLQERGHQVTIVHPLIPMKLGAEWHNTRKLASQVLDLLGNIKRGNRVDWFQLNASLKRALYFPEKYRIPPLERYVPDGDVVVATAWPTAYFVNNLSQKKGEKFYYIQHYESVEVWSESKLWDEAKEIEEDPIRLPLAVVNRDTSHLRFHKHREKVDGTYKLPLHKITISSWLKALLEEKFGQRVEALINCGINGEEFFNEHKQYNESKRVLMLHHTAKWKGVEDGLKAFEIAKERHPEIQLVMFGVYPPDPNTPSHAEFHHNISNDDLRKLYCSCDIFVCPSWVEGWPAPPMEAMACKCALVTTNVGWIPEYVAPGKTALVSPPRAPELLAKNIIMLLEDESLLRSISEAGCELSRNFTWDKATDELEQLFKDVLNRH